VVVIDPTGITDDSEPLTSNTFAIEERIDPRIMLDHVCTQMAGR